MTNRGPIRRYVDGFLHNAIFLYLYSGKGSWGDRLMNRTMPSEDGALTYPWSFAAGMLSQTAAEIVAPVLIYQITDSRNMAPFLAADVALKVIPRGIEYLVSKFTAS